MSFLASKPVHIPPRPAPAARPSNNPPSFTERLAAVEARAAELEARAAELAVKVEDLAAVGAVVLAAVEARAAELEARAAELAEKVEDLAAKLAHVEGD